MLGNFAKTMRIKYLHFETALALLFPLSNPQFLKVDIRRVISHIFGPNSSPSLGPERIELYDLDLLEICPLELCKYSPAEKLAQRAVFLVEVRLDLGADLVAGVEHGHGACLLPLEMDVVELWREPVAAGLMRNRNFDDLFFAEPCRGLLEKVTVATSTWAVLAGEDYDSTVAAVNVLVEFPPGDDPPYV